LAKNLFRLSTRKHELKQYSVETKQTKNDRF